MNKYLAELISQNHLTYDKKEKYVYGTVNGIQVSGYVNVFTSANVLSFHVRIPEERKAEVNNYFAAHAKTYNIFRFELSGDGIVCAFRYVLLKKYVACANEVSAYLQGMGLTECCPFCGEELNEGVRLVGSVNGIYRAHERCFDEYVEKVGNEEAARLAAPGNMPKAILGAVLGALAGAAIWVVLYLIGYLAMIAPIVGAVLGAFLWDKFGGKNNKTKIIVIWVVTVLVLTLTIFLTYWVSMLNAIQEAGVGGGAFEWFVKLMREDEEFKNAVITDTVLAYVFIVVANVIVTGNILKTQKLASKTFRKL